MKHSLTNAKLVYFLQKNTFLLLLCCMSVFKIQAYIPLNTSLYYFENNLTMVSLDVEENIESPSSMSSTKTSTTYATLGKTKSMEEVVSTTSFTAMMPSILIDSPCSCRENIAGSNGNATTTSDGQFIDIIQVSSITGETWQVVSATGFYDSSSPHPPLSPSNIAPGTLLPETAVGSGVYELTGIHVDAVGYSLTVTNGVDELEVANLCSYPEVAFTDLRTGYCNLSPAFALQADNSGLVGTATFTILDATTSAVLVADALVFEPAALGNGSYNVQYTFEETGGCTQTIEQTVDIVNPFMSLFCNNNLNVSLDENCEVLLTAEMLLQGNYASYGIFDVEVTWGQTAISNPISGNYEGQILTTKVINSCTGNYCWGSVVVEDKMKPSFDCPVAPVSVSCAASVEDVTAPIVTDNCDGVLTANLVNEVITDFSCTDINGLLRSVVREFTAFDANGNQVANNCIQVIEVPRADLVDVLFPTSSIEFECGSNPNTDPSETGFPTYNGIELEDGNICNFIAIHSDDTLSVCGGYKIVRTWTILDWCNDSSTPSNTISADQIIKVIDTIAPSFTCPEPITIGINQTDCTADFYLPNISITDECSAYSLQVFTPLGSVSNPDAELLSGFGIGTYFANYAVTDDCGNFDDCTVILSIVDNGAPVMVCDEITTVSINTTGTAEVSAVEFDDGSYDNCTNIDFAVRRMDGDGTYTPTVLFGCGDANNTVLIEVQATDDFGYSNSCMIQVNVEEDNPPAVTCPENVEINCSQNYADFFELPSATTTCGLFPLSYTEDINLNSCQVGDATRVYTITASNGQTMVCEQVITITKDDFLTLEDITFPTNPEPFLCGTTVESLAIDSLPLESQYPIINAPDCSQIATSHEDQFLDISEPACLRIARTWTVIDWCSYEVGNPNSPGVFVHTQLIDIIDNEAPILICPPNPFVKIINPTCDTTIFLFGPDTLMDCNPNIFVTATSVLGEGLGPFENVPLGLYDITLIADDGCGNVSYCDYVLQVKDNKPPTPYCVESLVITLMETGMIEVNIEDFNAGSFDNCTAPEDLLFSYSVNPFDSVQVFTCNNVGTNTIEMHVTDEGFNTDYCLVDLIIQNTMADCGAPRTVSGNIRTEMQIPVADVLLSVNGQMDVEGTTADGLYSLTLEEGEDYTLFPEKNINPKNGITTYDIVLIKQHILGMQPFDSPYKIIAADANRSGSVTTSDVVALKRLILTLDDTFQSNTSWRFIDADYVFPDPSNPFEAGFPEFWNINNLPDSQTDINFIAVKIGDVNSSASGVQFSEEGEERDADNVFFSVKNNIVQKGETHTVWLEANEVRHLLGLQGTISFDTEVLDFVEIKEMTEFASSDFNLNKTGEGNICLSWENAALSATKLGFGLTFQIKQTTDWATALSFTNETVETEAYKVVNNSANLVEVSFDFIENISSDFVVYQNTPNPFAEATNIAFELPSASSVLVSIYDISGKLLWTKESGFEKGFNQIEVKKSDLNSSGVLFYRLETNGFVATKRMMLL